jgi:hypothetical protein
VGGGQVEPGRVFVRFQQPRIAPCWDKAASDGPSASVLRSRAVCRSGPCLTGSGASQARCDTENRKLETRDGQMPRAARLPTGDGPRWMNSILYSSEMGLLRPDCAASLALSTNRCQNLDTGGAWLHLEQIGICAPTPFLFGDPVATFGTMSPATFPDARPSHNSETPA